jgi:probable F420-dependent oxidoreductase
MKIRIGFGLGTRTQAGDAATFGRVVDDLERLRFDSLWLSERISGPAPDPIVAMAFAAGRTERLKFGTSVLVLPGRNPVVLAKELASLDVLSGGRLLPAVGLGAVDPAEQAAFGVERSERGKRFDEMIDILRRCWTEERVDHDGAFYRVTGARVSPKPVQQPLELWLGGQADSELRRCGRLGDGWLPSFCDAADIARGKPIVEQAAADAGRTMDPEHWGALIAYSHGALPDLVTQLIAKRRPDKLASDLIPVGLPALRTRIGEMVDAGASKFVVLPIAEPADWTAELEALAAEILTLQN